jgi:predicted acyltransferase (DUF342 family)
MIQWFDQSANANKLRQSYLKGFLDISGGGIYLRSDNSMNFYSGVSARPTMSIGGTKMTIYTTDGGLTTQDDDVDVDSLRHLKGLHQNVQEFINGATNGQGNVTTGQITAANQDITGNLRVEKTLVVGGNATFKSNVGVAGNLQVGGNIEVLGDEYVHKALIVGGNCTIDGSLTVKGDVSMNDYHFSGYTISAAHDVSVNDHLVVGKDSSFNASLVVGQKLKVGSDASFGNNVDIAGHLKVASLSIGTTDSADDTAITFGQKLYVTADVSFGTKLQVGSDTSLNGALSVGGATSLHSSLAVDGATTLTSLATLNGGLTLSNSSNLTVNGTSTLTNGLSVTGGNVAVTNSFSAGADSSFNAKLAVAGNTSLAARLNVTGDVSMNGNATVANKFNAPHISATTDLTVAGDLKIYNDGTNSVIDATSGNIYLNPGLSSTNVGLVHIKNGLTVDGSINFTGQWIRTDTNVQFTTQIDISNNGTGPAIKCEQKGVNDVAYFLDDNFPVMKVLQGHKVAICKDTAAVALDVSGSINADANLTVTGTTTLTGDLSSTNGNISLTNGNVVLTNGKITTKTFEATSDATFDAKISMVGSGNFDMTGTTGFLCQW